ncbi:FAD-dependent monooxygenase OpS4, partial [Lachnellula suecica]
QFLPNISSKMSIHLIVIGAGLAGLSAALSTKVANPDHQVTILESVQELAEVGAGLQLTPNATRLFKPWGIYDGLAQSATFPVQLNVRRYDGTKILSQTKNFQDQISERYPGPFWGLHRVDLQRAMAARCQELGVTFRLSSKVTSVNFKDAEVVTSTGEVFQGDVVLCTDGLWSSTRSQFLGRPSPAILTGDLAYRIVINTKELEGPDKAELEKFIRDSHVNFWVGPETHVVAYTMRAGEVYNIVLLCPDNLPESVTKSDGDIDEMLSLFQGWDPVLTKFLRQVKRVAKWKLMWLDTLPEWANKQGTFLMAGDCCHPMLPYLAQGANSSLEDGAVLGYLLGKVRQETKHDQLPKAAAMYQTLRKQRGEDIAKETFKQREDFHMPDGEKQVARDEVFAGAWGREEPEGDFPSRWQCPRVQRWLYGYDAYAEVEGAFSEDPF